MSTPTWLLFESGAAVQVNLSLYNSPQGAVRLMDAYVVTECEGGFTKSARRAAEVVSSQLEDRLGAPQVVGFDLPGLADGCGLTGESGGLALSIALAKALIGDFDPGPVAATGELLSSNGRDDLGPVQGIEAKLMAAAKVLPANGWLFYPKANEADLSAELIREILGKGIRVQPVGSLAQALDLLFGPELHRNNAAPEKKGAGISGLRIALFLALFGAGLWFLLQQGGSPVPKPVPEPEARIELESEPEAVASRISTDFSGESSLTRELARELNSRVAELFKGAAVSMSLEGRVIILLITEDMDETAGQLYSGLTVAVRDLKINGQGVELLQSIKVEGPGRASSLIPQAADSLAKMVSVKN